jgi:hypothetical protein
VSCWFLWIIYTPHYIRIDGTGTESMAGKTRQDIKHQIKWLDMSLRLLDTLDYTLGITFYLPENYNIQQSWRPWIITAFILHVTTFKTKTYQNSQLHSGLVPEP